MLNTCQQRRLNRKLLGQCIACGKENSHPSCGVCLERRRGRYQARKTSNQCQRCEEFTGCTEKILCDVCSKKKAEISRRYNNKRVALERCSCGKPTRGKYRCKCCATKLAGYQKRLYETSTQALLQKNLRGRLGRALKKEFKKGSAVRDLGCGIDELKVHLENQFKEGMTWETYGRNGWHIDHIRPLSSFNLEDRNQLLEACHYSNLQPLWAEENLAKGSKLDW